MAKTERLSKHPVLPVSEKKSFNFYFNGQKCNAVEGEVISSSLYANGFRIFGHHYEDRSPQGIFCANGQCSQCLVIADGKAVKACMTPTAPGMQVQACEGAPDLIDEKAVETSFKDIPTYECEVLIVGGGPSGIAAAIELGKLGHSVILVDDKDRLGGKLVLQTHTFFGSIDDCHAGTRGIDIATLLAEELEKYSSVQVFLNSTAVGVFADKKVGIVQKNDYFLVKPEKLLIAAGARERALNFPGWDLPGIYGAGAFQTILNRDLVKPSERIFIIGGGNVGLIAAYHAMQAGITVVGLAEGLPQVSGYKVHADKIKRLGVPIYLSHSVIRADGNDEGVKTITVSQVDSRFNPISGTEKVFEVDTVLVAVGLTPVSEMYDEALAVGIDVFSAGDAREIAEASAAMFGGKIAGLKIAESLGDKIEIPPEWYEKEEILKSRPGENRPRQIPDKKEGIFPVFHCTQEIPCNPCTDVCVKHGIKIEGNSLMGLPEFDGDCSGCGKCVAICPGLAITLVDYRKSEESFANVTVPFELLAEKVPVGTKIPALDAEGKYLTDGEILSVKSPKFADRTLLVTLKVPGQFATRVAGLKVQSDEEVNPLNTTGAPAKDKSREDVIVCNCMRVTDRQIRERIRAGVRDMNQLKGETNCGMGACGGKTCSQLIMKIFREEGVAPSEVTGYTQRPPGIEIPLGVFAGMN